MPSTALLLPSPFLPPRAYDPLLVGLREIGYAVELADASRAVSGPDLVARWSQAASATDVLVAHSNAGYLAPLVRQRRGGPGVPVVFVDAALPPESGTTRLAPSQFREHLATLADEQGRLPPWTRWWPREAVAEVVPPDRLDRIDAECPRVPLAYVDSEVTTPDGWAAGPNAYLAFGGETYADELAFAGAHGWPSTVLPGSHLHFLWDPTGVAQAVAELAQALR